MITYIERSQLRKIVRKLLTNNTKWLDQQEILCGDKGDYWILNYIPGSNNRYNRLCRGLVIRKPRGKLQSLKAYIRPLNSIISFPFIRFHNHGENYINAYGKKKQAELDFAHSTMIEKLDGIMVGVFFPYDCAKNPEYHTRRMISMCGPDLVLKVPCFHAQEQVPLMRLIGTYVDKLSFSPQDLHYTYVFEFLHEKSRILTQYNRAWDGLWLLGARNLHTYEEIIDQKELDSIASRIGCRRPVVFPNDHDNMNKILSMMDQRAHDIKDFEGVVFLDQHGNRIKLKRAEYVALHHLLGEISYKHLIPRILNGETEEILAYFPNAKTLIDNFKQTYKNYWAHVVSRVKYWRDRKLDRKNLAIHIFHAKEEKDGFVQSQIMHLYLEPDDSVVWKDVDTALKNIAVGPQGSPKKLMDIIGLMERE